MFNQKALAPLYFMAFVASIVTFFVRHQWLWLAVAVGWLMLGIFYLRNNKDDNNLRK